MSTNVINLTDLAAQLTPRAVVGNPRAGVSRADLLSQGVNAQFIEAHMALGRTLTEIPELWSEFVRKQNAKLMQDKPVVAPYNSKAVSDASKRSVHVPYQSAPVPENETPEQELARLRGENAKLKAQKALSKLSLKVSEKGAVSVYGMGKWPVTLYAEQWLRLLGSGQDILAFIEENAGSLSSKE